VNQSVPAPSLGGMVGWFQIARPMTDHPHVLDTTCEIVLPSGRRVVDRLKTRAWTVGEVKEAAKRAELTLVQSHGLVATEEILEFRR
jgi:ribulose-5-phosphate 4-epimerase/fuculose-1-phosphate aldolase